MAKITEDAVFTPSIYQLGVNDPVVGGVPTVDNIGNATSGYSNVPIKQLADRTKFLKAGLDNVSGLVDQAETSAAQASTAADRAETAEGNAFANANLYETTAAGIAATAVGEQFQVLSADGLAYVRYRHDAGGVATALPGSYPENSAVKNINAKLPSMLRQSDSVAAGLAASQDAERFILPDEHGAEIYEAFGNLFDSATVVTGFYLAADGNTAAAADWAHSGFIAVTPGGSITIASNTPKRTGYVFYNANQELLGVTNNATGNPLTLEIPQSARFIRFNVQSPSVPQPTEIMVSRGGVAAYQPYGQKIARPIAALSGRGEIDSISELIESPNLFVAGEEVSDLYLRSTSPWTVSAAAGWAYYAIPATEGDVFTIYSPSGEPRRPGAAFFSMANPVLGDAPIANTFTTSGDVTVTAPAGTQSLLVNVRSSSVPIPSDLMIIRGANIIPYVPGGLRRVVRRDSIWPAEPAGVSGGGLSITFVQTPGATSSVYSEETGLTRRFIAIPEETVTGLPVRFNLRADLVDGLLLRDSADDIAPDHIDGGTVGANHGYSLGECTAVGHGKVAADCGSVWSFGSNTYVLADVVSGDKLLLADQNSNAAVPTGTYTYVSGTGSTASIAVTAVVGRQWYPPHRNWSLRAIADGKQLQPGSSEIAADKISFVEQADILARADIIAAWVNNGGIPGGYEPAGEPSIAETITYEYDKRAQLTIVKEWLVLKSIPISDLMGLQFLRPDVSAQYIIPGAIPFTHEGMVLDYSQGVPAEYTLASGVSVLLTPDQFQASGECGHRVLVVYPDVVFAIGFLPVGDADYDVRRDRVSDYVMELRGNTGKIYFRLLDVGTHVAAAGDQYSAIGYRHIVKKSPYRTAFYAVEGGGATWVYADWHNKTGLDRLPIDEEYPELIGKSFEIVEARNVTVKAGIIAGPMSVLVNAATGSASLILKVR